MNNNIKNVKRNFDEYCPNGFLLSEQAKLVHWDKVKFGQFWLYYSPSTKFEYRTDDKLGVLIIGECYDLIELKKTKEVINLIMLKLSISVDEAIKYIAYLGGRFLAVLYDENKTVIVPDSHCTYACYWSDKLPNVFSSHLQIFKDYFNIEKNKLLTNIMGSPDYISPGGKYFPAKLTPLENVYPIIANCYLESDANKAAVHKRFYPLVSLCDKYGYMGRDTLYILFKNFLINSLKLSYIPGNSYISLTNGLDSRAVLAASLLGNIKYDTFTYTKFGGDYPHYEKDLVGASKLSTHAGYSHFILVLPELDYGNNFYKMYSKTFSLHARFPTLAQAYYEQLPKNANVLISTISETGTVFYTERSEKTISPEALSKKWSTSRINSDLNVLKAFESYIEYTEFYPNKLHDYDFYDLYYWEHRNSKWANIWYQECDLSHNVVLPFNCRLINELMLAMSFEDRKSRYLLNRLINESKLNESLNYYA